MTRRRAIAAETFEDLRTLTGDDAFLSELIDTYVVDTASLLTTLDAALAQQDVESVRRAAHSLKSNSHTFGATALAELCAELEACGRIGTLNDGPKLLERIREEYTQVQVELRAVQTEVE